MKPIYFNIPPREEDPEDEVKDFLQKLKDNYLGLPDIESVKALINTEIHEFKEYMKYEYPDYDLTLDLKGDLAYHDAVWTIEDICKAHKLYSHETHIEKEEYTRMEVNNMLFDLKELYDVIRSYSQVAVPCVDCRSYNDEIFDGIVEVECRYYWEDYDKWEEYRHIMNERGRNDIILSVELLEEE